jgi:hypothetical protein
VPFLTLPTRPTCLMHLRQPLLDWGSAHLFDGLARCCCLLHDATQREQPLHTRVSPVSPLPHAPSPRPPAYIHVLPDIHPHTPHQFGLQQRWASSRSDMQRKARKQYQKKIEDGTMKAPPQMEQSPIRITRTSPGQIIDIYQPPEWLPAHPIYTVDGVKLRWANFMNMVRSTYSVALMKKQGGCCSKFC